MPDGGAVKLTIDSDKVGYVKLPNGGILTTSSGVINTTYNGEDGRIIYYIPKNNAATIAVTSELSGNVVYGGDSSEQLYLGFNSHLTGLTALNQTAGIINTTVCAELTSIIAPKAYNVTADYCALTAKSIGDILYAAYVDDRMGVIYDFRSGTNALQSEVDAYLQATYSVSYATVFALLDTTNNGTISIDTI